MGADPSLLLKEAGQTADGAINLTEAALAFSALAHPGLSVERYKFHVEKLTRAAGERFRALVAEGAADDAATRLAALKHVLADGEGYAGDEETYDDLQNADLVRVIERRKGMPIALAILYIQAGRNNGFTMDGLNFPGHFLCRIEHAGVRLIFDPFQRCMVMGAPDLRQLIKTIKGANAELSTDYYAAASNRDILVRLQNNIKLRLIEAGDYHAALTCIEQMRDLAPEEYRLLFDAGVLYVKTGQREKAVAALQDYIKRVQNPWDRRDAEDILRELLD